MGKLIMGKPGKASSIQSIIKFVLVPSIYTCTITDFNYIKGTFEIIKIIIGILPEDDHFF